MLQYEVGAAYTATIPHEARPASRHISFSGAMSQLVRCHTCVGTNCTVEHSKGSSRGRGLSLGRSNDEDWATAAGVSWFFCPSSDCCRPFSDCVRPSFISFEHWRERVLQKLNARRSSKTPVEDHLSIVHENTQNFGIDKPTVQSPRETLNTILVRMLRRDVADVNRIPESCL